MLPANVKSNSKFKRFVFLIFVYHFTMNSAQAGSALSVFDVRKNLPLSSSEPILRDYYINAGRTSGLSPGVSVDIVRKIPVHDPLQDKSQESLSIQIARVLIIHAEETLSIARLLSLKSHETAPMAEYEGILVGDTLDLTTIHKESEVETNKNQDKQ